MKKLTWFAGFLVFVLTQSAMAQEIPKFEIFGGYSFLRVTQDDNSPIVVTGSNGSFDSTSANGFMASMAWNFDKKIVGLGIGAVGEFSRHTRVTNLSNLLNTPPQLGAQDPRVSGRVSTFLFGPRFTLRTETIEPFGHFLVGGANGSFDISVPGVSTGDSGTAFTFSAGGGLDIKFSRKILVRLVQADYLRTPIQGSDLNSTRISTGLVYRIGSR